MKSHMERGYFTFSGYMGYVPQTQSYQLFATENEYYEYVASVND